MKKIISFVKSYAEVFGTIIVVIGIFIFVHYQRKYTDNHGVITVAKVTGLRDGDYDLEIYLEGKKYTANTGESCQRDCMGRFFFIKVLRNNPSHYVVLYGKRPVPDCILENVRYFKGWKEIPDCNNYY